MSRPVDTAVILAAGRGNRLAPAALGVPKPFLPLDGQSAGACFLDWHLDCLTADGVQHVVLVGNPETCGRELPGMAGRHVTWLLNPTPDPSNSGSAHSAAFAWATGVLDGHARVILMDADIVYEPGLLALLAEAPGDGSKILVHPDFRHTDEEVLVFADADGTPRLQGKGLLGTPMVEGLHCLGEATGVLLFAPRDHAALREASAWAIAFSTAKARSEHEDVTNLLLRQGRLAAVLCPPKSLFMEVDTPEEYAVLVTTVYPQLATRWPLRAP